MNEFTLVYGINALHNCPLTVAGSLVKNVELDWIQKMHVPSSDYSQFWQLQSFRIPLLRCLSGMWKEDSQDFIWNIDVSLGHCAKHVNYFDGISGA